MNEVPDQWRGAALDSPRAYAPLRVSGRLRFTPEDFVVEEELGFQPDDHGQHLLLRVRKRGANTEYVARMLARHARVRVGDVGFAGLKDRQAVAVQWFSVPRHAVAAESWSGLQNPEFSVIEVRAHRRKLRRGALAANRFRIRVRELHGDVASLEERLALIRARGVPNYFGPQRFGVDGNNLGLLADWLANGQSSSRSERSFTLSAGRSLLFNAVLAERVRLGQWDRLLAGELVNLDGSGSVFGIDAPTPELEARCAQFDVHPTGPLWGQGDLRVRSDVAALEGRMLENFAPLTEALEQAGLRQERRSLRLRVDALQARVGADLDIEFRLGAGAYATAVLRELVDA